MGAIYACILSRIVANLLEQLFVLILKLQKKLLPENAVLILHYIYITSESIAHFAETQNWKLKQMAENTISRIQFLSSNLRFLLLLIAVL